jgi:cell wall assembly regulator SMI1
MTKKRTPQSEAQGAIVRGEVDTLRLLIAEKLPLNDPIDGDRTPLRMAIDQRQPNIVRLLIQSGVDVNQGEHTPLMLAVKERQLSVVQALLAAGADVNRLDKNGMSALAHAADSKSGATFQVVRALIAAGARGDGEALAQAAMYASPDIIRAIVAAGAQVNEISRWGTPLILAVDADRRDNVETLLALGADLNLRLPADHRNFGGKTAIEVAKENKRKKIIALLEAAAGGHTPEPTPPPTPPATDDMPALWKRLKKALDGDVRKSLKKGTNDEKLAALEAKIGVQLPADFRASYLLVNGQDDGEDGIFPPEDALDEGYNLYPLKGILGEWSSWVQLTESGEFNGRNSSPDPGVRSDWWHRGWIPFATNGGGDSLCIDMAPADGGTVGQVISMSHESGDRPILAKSFAEFLALVATRLEEAEDEDEGDEE